MAAGPAHRVSLQPAALDPEVLPQGRQIQVGACVGKRYACDVCVCKECVRHVQV